MPGGLKWAVLPLTLACFASAETGSLPEPLFTDAEMRMIAAERERETNEDNVRSAVYSRCGGDSELRCQQFAPRILRGIAPTIKLRALRCDETERYPLRIRHCAFVLGEESGPRARCRVTFRRAQGPHSGYWTDELELPSEPSPADAPAPAIPALPRSMSSLVCDGPLLPLTRKPERADPAPASPPQMYSRRSEMITEDDYPLPWISQGKSGTVAMRLLVGSHGRIDRCTVTRSTGSEGLDERACDLLRARAFFYPARNAEGREVAAEIPYSHDWKVPQ